MIQIYQPQPEYAVTWVSELTGEPQCHVAREYTAMQMKRELEGFGVHVTLTPVPEGLCKRKH
jgi:hypothetical protein